MQVKKFEAPTLQEALDTIKRELGPEAIILQTKKHKRGFGLLSKASVEVTAAVSERSIQKKTVVERRMPDPAKEALNRMSANAQASVYDKYLEKHLARSVDATADRVELTKPVRAAPKARPQASSYQASGLMGAVAETDAAAATKNITSRRYIDIEDDETTASQKNAAAPISHARVISQAAPSDVSLEDEVKHLKRMLAEMKSVQEDAALGTGAQALVKNTTTFTPAVQNVFEQLVVNGLEKRYAFALVKKASFELGTEKCDSPEDILDQVAYEVMQSTEVLSPLDGIVPGHGVESGNGPVLVALVGPTGVGKTTTVAKIASEAILKRNLKVGLINLDGYKVAAFDQLATYAKILNVPFRSAQSAEDLRAAVKEFQTLDIVLIDTTGRSQRDPQALNDMNTLLKSVPDVRTQLVLSSTTRDTELYDMATRFSMFRPIGLVFSKLDEANIYGSMYNVCQKMKLPLLYFTTGQRVPEDIEEATRERVAALIMDL